jgi:hypothetical protein
MRGRDRVAGRHTLGSLPQSLEPTDSAPVPVVPPIPPLDNLTDGAEPFYTIYSAAWYAARERAQAAAEGAQRRMLVGLLDAVETGWWAVRDLQHWYDANYKRARQTDGYGHLLGFISGDLVDVYRELAGGVADLVPGWDGWEWEADPDGVLGDVDTFARYMAVLNLAAQSVAAPEPFAAMVASVSDRVSRLQREVSAIVTELCEEDDSEDWW